MDPSTCIHRVPGCCESCRRDHEEMLTRLRAATANMRAGRGSSALWVFTGRNEYKDKVVA